MNTEVSSASEKTRLIEVAKLFLKLGCIGFGGPAVHIVMMEEEVVRKKKWLSPEHFLDLIGATNLIPGPNSTEMAMHCGHERAGIKGLIVAGCCFIVPAVLITAVFAWAYRQYGSLPQVQPFIYGIKPAVIAVIVSVMIILGRKAVKTTELGIIAIACIITSLAGMNEIIVLFGAGLIGILLYLIRNGSNRINSFMPLAVLQLSNPQIFWTFLKIGSILYGSGYVLFAFLDSELVTTGILSRKELTDAIAVGQFTPGPVFSSATFIGWQIGGLYGAIAATLGIFLPSFLFVAFLNPLIPRLRKSGILSAFLNTVNAASIAIILAMCIVMAKDSVRDWRTIIIAAISILITLLFKKLNTAFVILGGACLGYILYLF